MIVINIADIHGNAKPIPEIGEILSSADLILLMNAFLLQRFKGAKHSWNKLRNRGMNMDCPLDYRIRRFGIH